MTDTNVNPVEYHIIGSNNYTTKQAKNLLRYYNINYTSLDMSQYNYNYLEMVMATHNFNSFPMIFKMKPDRTDFIGGYYQLYEDVFQVQTSNH